MNITTTADDPEPGEPKNSERQLVKIVTEICAEQGIALRKTFYDYILELERGCRRIFIFGHRFPNNRASVQELCDDKAALAEVLAAHGIPAVEHHLFMSPANTFYIGADGNWVDLRRLLAKHGRLVIKPNVGWGGNSVFLAEDTRTLEKIVHNLFRTQRTIAVSPFVKIDNEYRLIVLNSVVKFGFVKQRASVTGDGKKSIAQLIFELPDGGDTHEIADAALKDKSRIPAAGEKVNLTFKHNLGKGARAAVVPDGKLLRDLSALAVRATDVIGMNFCSVDIAEIAGKLHILEINSGVTMNHFAAQSPEYYALAKAVYREAIEAALA